MVSKDLGVTSATELDGATVCVQTGTTTELNLADFFKVNGISYQPVPIQTPAEADQQFLGGACDAYTTDASQLATQRAGLPGPRQLRHPAGDHLQGAARPGGAPGRRPVGGHRALDLNALVAAEEYGVTAANAEEMTASENPEIRRLVGGEGDLGPMLGLEAEWAKHAIMAGGNYGEIFATYIGEGTPSNIARGLNALWTEGGLQYSPPFR